MLFKQLIERVLSHPLFVRLAVGFAIAAIVLGVSLIPARSVQAGQCYSGNYYEEVNRNGSWHWRAVAFVKHRPIDTRVQNWTASGPRGASFWPNSISESYGKAYIYFSWPAHLYPTNFMSASKFTACTR